MLKKKNNSSKDASKDAVHSTVLLEFKSEFFKALASPLRIRILDELREGELSVSEIKDRLEDEASNVSQQLAILRAKNLVVGRKQGSNTYYRCTDETIFELLDVTKKVFNNHLVGVKSMLESL